MFDHRTVSLQSAETGCSRCLLDVLLEYIAFPFAVYEHEAFKQRTSAAQGTGRHVVWFTTSTLKLWNERKRNLGFTDKSNSEFTEALLYGIVPVEGSRSESSSVKWG